MSFLSPDLEFFIHSTSSCDVSVEALMRDRSRALQSIAILRLSVSDKVAAIQINYIKVPVAVKNDSNRPVIMDCNYSLRPDDSDLVVKWYLNDVLVYQWIPPQQPQSFGPLKDRLDLTYRATDDPKSVYRAMKIVNPTDEVAGEYKCFVSTFTDEDFSVRHMKVFVPEKSFDIFKSSFDEQFTNFTCLASEVYPAPKLLMYKTYKDEFNKVRFPTIHRELTKHNTRLFSSYVIATAPTKTLNPGTLILCEVRIPGTGYVRIKSLLYYPEGNI
ncbi:unnamed protein product [Phaedon cochleariae]|uniref:Ig-like domain-containing protein n=1 Tax=Phaedon cochleariae TaxID=80249 RepID=A0A9N9X070_PHACE|nr:unnamed protein product [Phaedon cochleariae]